MALPAGGETVTLTGVNFLDTSAAMFGTTAAPSATIVLGHRAHGHGAGRVGRDGRHRCGHTGKHEPLWPGDWSTISPRADGDGMAPWAGKTTGGGFITITGTGFTWATAVYFGSTSATFTAISPTTILADIPAHGAGVIDVTVTTPGGRARRARLTSSSSSPPRRSRRIGACRPTRAPHTAASSSPSPVQVSAAPPPSCSVPPPRLCLPW